MILENVAVQLYVSYKELGKLLRKPIKIKGDRQYTSLQVKGDLWTFCDIFQWCGLVAFTFQQRWDQLAKQPFSYIEQRLQTADFFFLFPPRMN